MKLYDFVFNIIGGKSKPKFSEYNEQERADYSQFMINKVISMDYDLVQLAQHTNTAVNKIPDEVFDKALRAFIPPKRYDVKYKKRKRKTDKNSDMIIEKISEYYSIPYRDAKMYYDHELTEDQINLILEEFGIVL